MLFAFSYHDSWYLLHWSIDLDEKDSEDGDTFNYHDMIRRDKRRWARADLDNDSMLTKEEFSNFLHPEESEHMKDIVIDASFCLVLFVFFYRCFSMVIQYVA